jgi:hypothetical protein
MPVPIPLDSSSSPARFRACLVSLLARRDALDLDYLLESSLAWSPKVHRFKAGASAAAVRHRHGNDISGTISGYTDIRANVPISGRVKNPVTVRHHHSRRLRAELWDRAKRGCRVQQESRARGAETVRSKRDSAWANGASAPQRMILDEC